MAGFQVFDDSPEQDYSISIMVMWTTNSPPSVDLMQTALTDAYAQAFAQATEKLEA